ncbi:MAG: MBL fold metallo-hydrolase [Anaerolineae bacterium]
MKIGAVRAEIVSDGIFWLDAGGHFGLVPRVMWEKVAQPDERNRVRLALNCLYLESEGKKILVDTGLGGKLRERQIEIYSLERNGGLLGSLDEIGVAPEEIDIVVDTHLHSDHCGGNTVREGDSLVPAFPVAEYWVQRGEWEQASRPNERTRTTYLSENFEPIADRVRLLDGDASVTGEVHCRVTPGHTRHHQSVIIESEGEAAIFLADLSPWAIHFERLAWIPAYDVEPLVTLETKRLMQRWALSTDALLIFEHDPGIPLGRLRQDKERLRMEPVPFQRRA